MAMTKTQVMFTITGYSRKNGSHFSVDPYNILEIHSGGNPLIVREVDSIWNILPDADEMGVDRFLMIGGPDSSWDGKVAFNDKNNNLNICHLKDAKIPPPDPE